MKYTTVANVAFGVGALLGLSEAQAKPRAAYLSPVPDRKGWYTTTAEVHLKRGETFFSEDVLPKSMVDLVDFEGKEDLKVQTSAQKGSKKGQSKQSDKSQQKAGAAPGAPAAGTSGTDEPDSGSADGGTGGAGDPDGDATDGKDQDQK